MLDQVSNRKLVAVGLGGDLRDKAARLISATYLLNYGAAIRSFPKTLIALADDRQRVHAAAGLRDFSEPYFSEYYLDAPIEAILSAISRKQIDRGKIVEVSSLASRTPAISVQFMKALISYGEALGYDWAFFTATGRLERLLRRMHLPLIDLGPANSRCVPSAELWGSYYETEPRVLAFGREQLTPFLASKRAPAKTAEFCLHG